MVDDSPKGKGGWRQVHIELLEDDDAMPDSIHVRLEPAGLRPPAHASKLERALRAPLPQPTDLPVSGGSSSAGQAVLAYLCEQLDELITHDPAAREHEHVAVRRMRVATQRLRSALSTFHPLLDRRHFEDLRGELGRLAVLLGGPRDAEVLLERLHAALDAQPETMIVGPVRQRIDLELGEAHTRAHGDLLAALDGERYLRLLDALETLVAQPPLTARAHRAATSVLPDLVARAHRRLRAAAAAADQAVDRENRDGLLLEVRTAARCARYAAECVTPVLGEPAARLARRMAAVQKALRPLQDSVAARSALRELGLSARRSGADGFTFGLLHGLECGRADSAERAYRRVQAAAVRSVDSRSNARTGQVTD